MLPASIVNEIFNKEFGSSPRLFRAPGRVNIIGEHTDYNQGFVLPASINKAAYLAISPAEGNTGRWISADFQEMADIDFENIRPNEKKWANYLLGVIDQFKKQGNKVGAFNLVLAADVPVGAGLSSSAALESVIAFALNSIFGFGYSNLELAIFAQRAENEFIGLQCGIMDMFASLHGKKGQVMKLDCRSLQVEYFPLELGDYKILLLDTGVKHSLASSEYNTRRKQCEEGVSLLRKYHPSIGSLRDVDREMLVKYKSEMDSLVFKRCYFIIEENLRVEKVCDALKLGSLEHAGEYMYASHEGLQYDYEVSCAELDLLVELVKGEPSVLGARMMGGGFGGCTINLMEKISIPYKKNTGIALHGYEVVTGDGASEINN
jgi:galactokinase